MEASSSTALSNRSKLSSEAASIHASYRSIKNFVGRGAWFVSAVCSALFVDVVLVFVVVVLFEEVVAIVGGLVVDVVVLREEVLEAVDDVTGVVELQKNIIKG